MLELDIYFHGNTNAEAYDSYICRAVTYAKDRKAKVLEDYWLYLRGGGYELTLC